MRYKLHRERKRNLIPTRYVLVGNVMHYASEQLLLGSRYVNDIVEDALRDFDRRVAEATTLGWDEGERAEQKAKVEQGVWRLAELFDDEFEEYRKSDMEAEMHLFQFYQGWALEGYMDVVWVPDDYPLAVYDVKTGSSHKAGQLQFYGVLCEAYFGQRPQKLAWIEPLGRGVVEVPVTDEEHAEMKDRIQRVVRMIASDEFETSGFPKKCSRCNSEPFCPATEKSRAMKLG